MSGASWASPQGISERAWLLVGLGLVLGLLFLIQANTSVGTELGDAEVIPGELIDDAGTALPPDAATEDRIALGFNVYVIDGGPERHPVPRLGLTGLLARGPPL
jgi:hypothetical protein